MKRHRTIILGLVGLLACGGWGRPEDANVSTATSELYPQITCTATNAGVASDVIQLAESTRDQLGPLLQINSVIWRFPVHIRVVLPDDPLAASVMQSSVKVVPNGKILSIEALVLSTDPLLREFVQRQFVTALLWEKFFTPSQIFDATTRLDVAPLWLTEGLREWLNEDPDRNRESIVKRSAQTKRAPSLEDITSWRELSDDRLMGLWQRAFCYYLVNSLVRPGSKRNDFQLWISTVSGPNPTAASLLFPTEAGWQRELLASPERSRDIVYTWDESMTDLAAAETIAITAKKTPDTHISTLETILSFPPSKELDEAVKKKIFDLTALELRADSNWRPIIALYRFGLTALTEEHDRKKAQKLLAQAQQLRTQQIADHQKLLDYMNWFQVTQNYSSGSTAFRNYFQTAAQMENAEADPRHPNPIRANLLHVESQL